ncbi:MAG: fimbrillin family protein [Bacteroidales bacterium]|nr:fimbrillin family protein [Bacteroidales bacterium]
MNKSQLILAAALVALAACEKGNLDYSGPQTLDNEIGFMAVNRKATKANGEIISGTTYATDNTFQVWGWQSEGGAFAEFADAAASNFMSNLTISYCGGPQGRADAWRNADHYYYWPFTGKISFLALHPSTVAPTTTGWDATNLKPKATIADYTIVPGTNETVDLMFATNEGSRRADALPMVFKHALSQIEVQVKTDEDYSTDVAFDVESVQFNNIDLSGDVAYANDAFSWNDNDTQTQNWVYYNTVLEDITDSYQVYGAAKVNIPQPANYNASILDPSDPLYDAGDAVAATITIGYSMEQTGSAKITGTVTIADPFLSVAANAWEAGKKYNYTINFRLNEILFNPSVTDWVDVAVTTINIY